MLTWTYYGPFLTVALSPSSLSHPVRPFQPLSTPLPFASPIPSVCPSCPRPLPFLLPLFAPEICTMSLEGNTGQRACDVGLCPPPHLDTWMVGLYADGDNVYRHPIAHSHVHTGTQEAPQHITCSFCNCLLKVMGWTQRDHTSPVEEKGPSQHPPRSLRWSRAPVRPAHPCLVGSRTLL